MSGLGKLTTCRWSWTTLSRNSCRSGGHWAWQEEQLLDGLTIKQYLCLDSSWLARDWKDKTCGRVCAVWCNKEFARWWCNSGVWMCSSLTPHYLCPTWLTQSNTQTIQPGMSVFMISNNFWQNVYQWSAFEVSPLLKDISHKLSTQIFLYCFFGVFLFVAKFLFQPKKGFMTLIFQIHD